MTFSKKMKIPIHAFTRLLAQCIIKANPINCQIIEESESLSDKEKKKIVSELLYFRLVLLYFMMVFEGTFGGKFYDDHQCSPIRCTLGTNRAIRSSIKLTRDFPVIIAF